MKIQLTNNFHGTSASLLVNDLRIAAEIDGQPFFCTISADQYNRAARTLCGMKDCTCGSVRGPQTHNDRRLIVMRDTPEAGLVRV